MTGGITITWKLKSFFESHPVFRYAEFSEFMQKMGTQRVESWRQQLNYHLKAGRLIHVRKFLYAVKPFFNQEPWIAPYLITSRVTADAVIAYHTALEMHRIAYTTFNEFTFLVQFDRIYLYLTDSYRYIIFFKGH